jgi:hypothetical protein
MTGFGRLLPAVDMMGAHRLVSTPSRPWLMSANWKLNLNAKSTPPRAAGSVSNESPLASALSDEFIPRLQLNKSRLNAGQSPL